jgi:hypothetical protein
VPNRHVLAKPVIPEETSASIEPLIEQGLSTASTDEKPEHSQAKNDNFDQTLCAKHLNLKNNEEYNH